LWTYGALQLTLWCVFARLGGDFTPGSDVARRPVPLIVALLAANFLLYLASLACVWNVREGVGWHARLPVLVLAFAVVFRLPLWWSQPIQEVDLYRYLWDGRVLQAGVNPYRYTPAQVDEALQGQVTTPALEVLVARLHRSEPLREIFHQIEHRSVATIYLPLSQVMFAVAAWLTPERSPVLSQVRVLKGILLAFDFAVLALVMCLLRNIGQPVGRALAYGWCPLIIKEFANSGHLDSIAVCFTTATLWLLTRSRDGAGDPASLPLPSWRVTFTDWLAATTLACATLAKLYPFVLASLLLAYGWRRLRWQLAFPAMLFASLLAAGYAGLPRNLGARGGATSNPAIIHAGSPNGTDHSSFSGLGKFLRRWEMNDLLFAVVYENLRPVSDAPGARARPWFVFVPARTREGVLQAMNAVARFVGVEPSRHNLPFLFTQVLMGAILAAVVISLALRRWPDDRRGELLRRAFLCLAWLWYLSATQNPWYWSWALPLVLFVSRPWLLVSGFALLYYLRFWFIYHIPETALPGGLNSQRFFDEVVVWVERLPVLLWGALESGRKKKLSFANHPGA